MRLNYSKANTGWTQGKSFHRQG